MAQIADETHLNILVCLDRVPSNSHYYHHIHSYHDLLQTKLIVSEWKIRISKTQISNTVTLYTYSKFIYEKIIYVWKNKLHIEQKWIEFDAILVNGFGHRACPCTILCVNGEKEFITVHFYSICSLFFRTKIVLAFSDCLWRGFSVLMYCDLWTKSWLSFLADTV